MTARTTPHADTESFKTLSETPVDAVACSLTVSSRSNHQTEQHEAPISMKRGGLDFIRKNPLIFVFTNGFERRPARSPVA